MKTTQILFTRLLSYAASLALSAFAAATPLKVYILAGQSNMEGHAKIETFDYIGDDPVTAPLLKQMRVAAPSLLPEFKGNVTAVETAPFWSEELAAIDAKHGLLKSKRHGLEMQVKAGEMTKEAAEAEGKKMQAELITPAEAALWNRGASNQGYHYLGCAKTFALMGKAFAEAMLKLQRSEAGVAN